MGVPQRGRQVRGTDAEERRNKKKGREPKSCPEEIEKKVKNRFTAEADGGSFAMGSPIGEGRCEER